MDGKIRDDTIHERAEILFDYLYKRDNERKADIIVGFGAFDLNIPRRCGELYGKGLAGKILFTGGRGAGTIDIVGNEADAFAEVLKKHFPEIPESAVLLENSSANTGDNVRFSDEVLKAEDPGFCFSNGIGSIIAVANPYRQRRVHLTMKQIFPGIDVVNLPPEATFRSEAENFALRCLDIAPLLAGEIERLMTYPEKGFIACEAIPEIITAAYNEIKQLL